MDIWHYDQRTGELISNGVADPDQLVPGNWVIPAHATKATPPSAVAGYARVYRGDGWQLIQDHRGETWYAADGAAVIVVDLCDPEQLGMTRDPPPPTRDELMMYATQQRDRLINAGVIFGGAMIQTRPDDRENIRERAAQAERAVADGAGRGDYRWADPTDDFVWIAADNSLVRMDAYDVIALDKAVLDRKRRLIFAARAIKDLIGEGAITSTAEIDARLAAV